MDNAVRIVAERKIETAIDEGEFDNLPQRGQIDCSLSGERFFTKWWHEKIERDAAKSAK